MATVTKTAGVSGSITLTTQNRVNQLIVPVSAPVVKWYTNDTRTTGELTLTTTGSGSTYVASWTAAQAPAIAATRYLKVTIEVSAGVFDIDSDDDISFVDAATVIGNAYITVADVRTLANMADTAKPTDAQITEAVAWFETVFEDYTNVAWVPRTTTETVSGDGGSTIKLTHRYPRSISAVTVTTNGVATALTAAELADLVIYDNGQVARLTLGRWPRGQRNVSVTYSYGLSSPPADVLDAAKVAVREHLLEGAVGNRQLSVTTELGLLRNSSPDADHPFGIPRVDEVARRRRHPDIGIG